MENVKIAVIHGEDMLDGNIDVINRENPDRYHIDYLLEYINKNYKENEMFKNMNRNETANSIGLKLKDIGNIVFFDITTYLADGTPNYNGKSGIIMLPENVTEKQTEALDLFKSRISDYTEVSFWFNFKEEDGMANCMCVTNTKAQVNAEEFITEFINAKLCNKAKYR